MSDETQIRQPEHVIPEGAAPNPPKNKNKKLIIILAAVVVVAAGAVAAALYFMPSGNTGKAVISGHDSEDEDSVEEIVEVAPAEAAEVMEAEPEAAYSAAYWLAGSFTDEYGVERPLCLELEAHSIDDSPRGKIHNLNANAAVFVRRTKTDSDWIYRGQDRGRQYTLIIPQGSANGNGAVLDINGNRALVTFNGSDYFSAHSAANAATNQAKDINEINSVNKVRDDYYRY